MIKIEEEKIREIMQKAQMCHAWAVAIMLAAVLHDTDSAEKFANSLVQRNLQPHIPLIEQTPERFAEEKEKVLAEYYR